MARRRRKRKGGLDPVAIGALIGVAILGLIAAQDLLPIILRVAIVAAVAFGAGYVIWMYIQKRHKVVQRSREFEEYVHINQLLALQPSEFEQYVGWAFEEIGYKAKVVGRRGDHGIDVELSRNGRFKKAQVKRYGLKHPVPEKEVRDFYGSYAGEKGVSGGYFVTTSDFTMPARLWAKARGIRLINGKELLDLIRRKDRKGWAKKSVEKQLELKNGGPDEPTL